jgi:ribulose-phosphate 3-epimerase
MLEKEKNNETNKNNIKNGNLENIDYSKICPSIFASNFLNLERNLIYARDKGVKIIHIDIMDGHFVPNISFGPKVSKDIISFGYFLFDSHLMVENPEDFIELFAEIGSTYITIHFEIDKDIKTLLKKIKTLNCKAGISLKPKTSFSNFINEAINKDYLNLIDLILIMSVEPGFSGQKFIIDSYEKLKEANNYRKKNNLNYIIQVDGGVNFDNFQNLLNFGADLLVMGSNFFK